MVQFSYRLKLNAFFWLEDLFECTVRYLLVYILQIICVLKVCIIKNLLPRQHENGKS